MPTQQNQRLPGAPEGKVRLNLVRSFSKRTADGGTETYGPGICDVPPDVAYTLSLAPEYVETDGVGNPAPHTIEARDPAVQALHSMPAPDVAFGQGIDFNSDAIARQRAAQDEDLPQGADRQGGRLNVDVEDSPLLDTEQDHPGKQPGQREPDEADRAQLVREVDIAQREHDQRVALGEHEDDQPLRISENSIALAEDSETAEATEGADAFSHFAEASEGAGDPRAQEGAGKPAARKATKRGAKKAGSKRGAKKAAAKRAPKKRESSE